VSGTLGEDAAVEAMKAGADDYVMKNHLARLVPAMEREFREPNLRRQHRQAAEGVGKSNAALERRVEGKIIWSVPTPPQPEGVRRHGHRAC
jgi:DNA-binding NtrC family response regulator